MSILRDPDGFSRRFQEAQRPLAEYAEAVFLPRGNKTQEPSGLMALRSEKKSASQGLSLNDSRTIPSLASAPPPGDSMLVEDDGSATYKGKVPALQEIRGQILAFIVIIRLGLSEVI